MAVSYATWQGALPAWQVDSPTWHDLKGNDQLRLNQLEGAVWTHGGLLEQPVVVYVEVSR